MPCKPAPPTPSPRWARFSTPPASRSRCWPAPPAKPTTQNGRKVELFTNRAGRFGAQGLAPGRWVIEMPTEPEPTRYVVDIPDGVKGLHNAGILKPSSGGQLMAEAKQ